MVPAAEVKRKEKDGILKIFLGVVCNEDKPRGKKEFKNNEKLRKETKTGPGFSLCFQKVS